MDCQSYLPTRCHHEVPTDRSSISAQFDTIASILKLYRIPKLNTQIPKSYFFVWFKNSWLALNGETGE